MSLFIFPVSSAVRDGAGLWEVVNVRVGPALIPVARLCLGVTAEQIDAGTEDEWKIEYYLFIEGFQKGAETREKRKHVGLAASSFSL